MKNFKSKSIFLAFLFIGFFTINVFGQSPGDVIDSIKDAEQWTDLFGLYDMIMMALTLIITQIGKFIPGVKDISGPWRALAVAVIIVVAGALKFGVGSIVTPVVIWGIVTLIYDKLLKPKTDEKK